MPRAPRPTARPAKMLAGTVLGIALSTGCGTPPELAPRPGVPVPSPSTTAAGPTATPSRPPLGFTPSPPPGAPTTGPDPGQGGYTAVPCAGNPSGAQVVDLVRRSPGLVQSTAQLKVLREPLCAGTWQYAVVQVTVPNHGSSPMQVVTNGRASSLILVTAGSNVCNAQVRVSAPPGIRTLACDAGLITLGSA